jgi:Secretion system C-terminal sorting domain
VAKFTFNNILLADSNVNEDASHGFLRYTIKPKTGLPANTVITNTADIYFDFNAPVITNQTFNTLVYTLPTGVTLVTKAASKITVKPNPFSDNATINYANKLNQTYSLWLYSLDGQLIEKLSSNESSMQVNSSKMNSGVYIFELINEDTQEHSRGKFVVNK